MTTTLYLHIGMSKTATSTLQECFFENRDKLKEEAGILFPNEGKLGPNFHNHFRLYFCFTKKKHFLCPPDIGTPEEEWSRVLEEAKGTGLDVLISCEAMVNLSVDHYREIKRFVGDEYQIKLIAYVRRIDKHTVSWVSQAVKSETRQRKKVSIKWMVKRRMSNYENFPGIADLFGPENFIVRPFERSQFYKNDIIADFFHYGLNMENYQDFPVSDQQVNPSLGKYSLEYKLLVNTFGYSPGQMVPIARALEKYTLQTNEEPAVILTAGQAKKLVKAVKKEEDWIARNLLVVPAEKLFDEKPLSNTERVEMRYKLSLQRAVEISHFLLTELLPHEDEARIDSFLDGAIINAVKKGKRKKEIKLKLIGAVLEKVIKK